MKAGRNGTLIGVPNALTVHSAERALQDRDGKKVAGMIREPAEVEPKGRVKDFRGGKGPQHRPVNSMNGGSVANPLNRFQRFI